MSSNRPPRHLVRRAVAVLACAATCLSLAACEPVGRAVGDTQDVDPEVAHIGEIKQDMLIGLVGASGTADMDRMVLDALQRADVHAVYAAVGDVSGDNGNGDDDAHAATAAAMRQSVEDFIDRRASVIVIDALDASGTHTDSWTAVLNESRAAGIPVALLNPVNLPADDTLYAASLTVNDRAADATPVAAALADIIDDVPHDRDIMVSTVADDPLIRP
ncbi:hypothetical protein DSM100688_0247 [Bifidobacterium ramosum]|uniref:Sugar ABC transporter substrate-binding protein n=1 Tax=Bifidobacterium ramosum TaxID=1798158 RepID=A0A6L4X4R0_9BIFI|nr:hypothetical protein [Bifidobacterium ramosum]KAB8289167.1 hypothetical protein DSM100688_0247 [Bifidobacterium ramosum]NEG70876.1 hypothetical protein [Bifidobacterium ramosum]